MLDIACQFWHEKQTKEHHCISFWNGIGFTLRGFNCAYKVHHFWQKVTKHWSSFLLQLYSLMQAYSSFRISLHQTGQPLFILSQNDYCMKYWMESQINICGLSTLLEDKFDTNLIQDVLQLSSLNVQYKPYFYSEVRFSTWVIYLKLMGLVWAFMGRGEMTRLVQQQHNYCHLYIWIRDWIQVCKHGIWLTMPPSISFRLHHNLLWCRSWYIINKKGFFLVSVRSWKVTQWLEGTCNP